jgi:hypothetical protein
VIPEENGDSEHIEARPAVNAAKIDSLRSTFQSFREETRTRLNTIQRTQIAVGTAILGGLISVIATLITLL